MRSSEDFSHSLLHLNCNSLLKHNINKQERKAGISTSLYKMISSHRIVRLVDTRLNDEKQRKLEETFSKKFHIISTKNNNISRAGVIIIIQKQVTDEIIHVHLEKPDPNDGHRIGAVVYKDKILGQTAIIMTVYVPPNKNKAIFLNKTFNILYKLKDKYRTDCVLMGTDANIRLDEYNRKTARKVQELLEINQLVDSYSNIEQSTQT